LQRVSRLKLYFPAWNVALPKLKVAQATLMPSNENNVFYLKLQWMSCKDEEERKKIAEKIRQALAQSKN
jgi:hypothetical protein